MTDGLVRRKRLFDALSTTHKIRVITAPSGFGKTTLVRTWVDTLPSDDFTLVWIALSDDVPTRRELWQLVATGMARSGLVSSTVHRQLTSEIDAADDPVSPVSRLLDGCGSVLLVIDAYERLIGIGESIDDDLVRLVAELRELDVVVTTRGTTPLADEVLVMRGIVRVVDESELAFTTEEIEQLLEMHAPQAVSDADRIARGTRGYPLAARAVAHSLSGPGEHGTADERTWQRLVTQDLTAQIADPKVVAFVLDTSVPPYFDSVLASRLTDGEDVDTVLAQLEWNGFGRWIPYAHAHPVFQYVESVRDVFLAKLRSDDPRRYARAAGRSAAWLHHHGDHGLALSLAIDAEKYALASSICRSLVMTNPDIYTTSLFERHLRRVPRAALNNHSTFAFLRAMAYAASPATRASAAEYFHIAAAHALDDVERLSPRDALHQYVGLQVCFRYLGRNAEAATAARACLDVFDELSSADRDEIGDFVSLASTVCAYSLLQVGEVDRARAVAGQAVTSADLPWWRNYALGFVVGIDALDGRGPDARAAVAVSDPEMLVESGRRLPHVLGVLGQAVLRLDELDFSGAVHEFDRARWLMDVAESWPYITWVLMHARLADGQAGAEARRVAEALSTRPGPPGIGQNLGTTALLNALAVLWLADGRAHDAHSLLRSDTPCPGQLAPATVLHQLVTGDPAGAVRDTVALLTQPGHTIRSTTAVETLGAAAALRGGNVATCLELLERATARYEVFGVRAHLLYVPDSDLMALRDVAHSRQRSAAEAYLAGVSSPIRDVNPSAVRLSRREIEALRASATFATRAEVADALFVSANTVKSQLSSAYRKLGVTTKDEAIRRAVELGLLQRP